MVDGPCNSWEASKLGFLWRVRHKCPPQKYKTPHKQGLAIRRTPRSHPPCLEIPLDSRMNRLVSKHTGVDKISRQPSCAKKSNVWRQVDFFFVIGKLCVHMHAAIFFLGLKTMPSTQGSSQRLSFRANKNAEIKRLRVELAHRTDGIEGANRLITAVIRVGACRYFCAYLFRHVTARA